MQMDTPYVFESIPFPSAPVDPRESEATNERRNLHVSFSCSTHAKPEPLVCDLTVYGLNRAQRAKLTAQQDLARRTCP